MKSKPIINGRGAQSNTHNRFFELQHELRDDFLEYCQKTGDEPEKLKTQFLEVFPKTIVNKVTSPDVGMEYSMNPYQGCEHGCVYCYARNSHEYWGFNAGLEFENRILIKKNAPLLLEKLLKKKTWKAQTIVLSGNTDCYQPADKKFRITRQCLEVFLKYKHPVAIITKNALVLRDLDILKQLAKDNLVQVCLSITSLSEKTRRLLEPRTVSTVKRLKTVKTLSENGIPVSVMLAPIIPAINSHEILPLAKAISEAGALSFGHTIVRLNGSIGQIFSNWLKVTMPNKVDKVLHQIAECHGGQLNDSRFKTRMRGEGKIADQIHMLVKLAKKKYFKNEAKVNLNLELYEHYKQGQLKLF